MNVLYFFDEDGPDRRSAGSALAAWAEGRAHDLVVMRAPPLNPCLGCFGCWVKTPGRCVVRTDDQARVLEAFFAADLVVLGGATPYGCFALPIKAALDRAIPLLLPYFRRFRGEMHHVPRYRRLPRMLSAAFGEASAAEDETFLELSRSFCDNFSCRRQKRAFRFRGDAADAAEGAALAAWLDEELAS